MVAPLALCLLAACTVDRAGTRGPLGGQPSTEVAAASPLGDGLATETDSGPPVPQLPTADGGCAPTPVNGIACGCGLPLLDSDGDGMSDCTDRCPDDRNKLAPGVCGCGALDRDSDQDGVLDCLDDCPADVSKTAPGACGCGVPDRDGDADGIPDCKEQCPTDDIKIMPGICGCGVADFDRDHDGTPDCHDGCPEDGNKLSEGVCGCGTPDDDSDGDGIPDCADDCPDDPFKVRPGICDCGTADVDSDDDGAADCRDECPDDPDKTRRGECGCFNPEGEGLSCPTDRCTASLDLVSNGRAGLGLCEGDCDSDADCVGDLRCFHTTSANPDQPVPGCNGRAGDSNDFCYDPDAAGITFTAELVSDDEGKLRECEADCDHDGECSAGLICWQSDANKVVSVPGCLGTTNGEADYCIDPSKALCP